MTKLSMAYLKGRNAGLKEREQEYRGRSLSPYPARTQADREWMRGHAAGRRGEGA